MPGAVAELAELGVDPPGHPLLGIRYLGLGARGRGRLPRRSGARGPTYGSARGVGSTRSPRPGSSSSSAGPTDLRQDGDGVVVDGTRARYLVAADGLHSPMRHRLGLDVARPDGARSAKPRYGLRQHLHLAPWSSHVEVHWGRHSEAYVTPVADDLVGVAVLSSLRGSLATHLEAFPELRERIAGAVPADSVRGAGPLRQSARRRSAGRVLLVGDAAGYVDALTGEGIALALGQARAAVEAVLLDDPEHYERSWTSLTRRYRWLTGGLVTATRAAPVRRALVPAARLLPAAFDLAVNALAEPVGRPRVPA